MPQNVASDQGLHCLPFCQQFLDTSAGIQIDLYKVYDDMVKSRGVQILVVGRLTNLLNGYLFKANEYIIDHDFP